METATSPSARTGAPHKKSRGRTAQAQAGRTAVVQGGGDGRVSAGVCFGHVQGQDAAGASAVALCREGETGTRCCTGLAGAGPACRGLFVGPHAERRGRRGGMAVPGSGAEPPFAAPCMHTPAAAALPRIRHSCERHASMQSTHACGTHAVPRAMPRTHTAACAGDRHCYPGPGRPVSWRWRSAPSPTRRCVRPVRPGPSCTVAARSGQMTMRRAPDT